MVLGSDFSCSSGVFFESSLSDVNGLFGPISTSDTHRLWNCTITNLRGFDFERRGGVESEHSISDTLLALLPRFYN